MIDSAVSAPAGTSLDPSTMSWDHLVRTYRGQILRHARHLTGDLADAEDLTQDVFLRIFRALPTYRHQGNFSAWIRRITVNLFLDRHRRRGKILFEPLPEDTDRLPGTSPDPESRYLAGCIDVDILAALDSLPPAFRAAVLAYDLQSRPYVEIAREHGVPIGTIRSRICRGRALLRAELAHRRRPNEQLELAS